MRYRNIVTAAAAALALAGGVATAAQAAAATSIVNVGRIVTGNGTCLTAAHGKVSTLACNSANRANWTVAADQTISFGNAGCLVAAPGRNGSAAMLGSCASADALWLPVPGPALESLNPRISPQSPLCLVIHTRLLLRPCRAGSYVAIPHTVYAASRLTNRPDSGGGGNWALDNITRGASVTWLGGQNYDGAIADAGTFTTIAGALDPNQVIDAGLTLGVKLPGTMAGHWGYTFSASASPVTRPPADVRGSKFPTGTWYELFFAPGTTFGGAGGLSAGPAQWSWSYLTTKDACGRHQSWVDANNDNGGQGRTGLDATDITAPAPQEC
jgi:hypothetical protein